LRVSTLLKDGNSAEGEEIPSEAVDNPFPEINSNQLR
jgi:hypothetical protein